MMEPQQQIVYYVPQRSTTDNAVSVAVILFTLMIWTLPVLLVGGIISLAMLTSGGAWIVYGFVGGLLSLAVAGLPLYLAFKL